MIFKSWSFNFDSNYLKWSVLKGGKELKKIDKLFHSFRNLSEILLIGISLLFLAWPLFVDQGFSNLVSSAAWCEAFFVESTWSCLYLVSDEVAVMRLCWSCWLWQCSWSAKNTHLGEVDVVDPHFPRSCTFHLLMISSSVSLAARLRVRYDYLLLSLFAIFLRVSIGFHFDLPCSYFV